MRYILAFLLISSYGYCIDNYEKLKLFIYEGAFVWREEMDLNTSSIEEDYIRGQFDVYYFLLKTIEEIESQSK